MAALDRFIQMQQEGKSEQQIINSLREEGFPLTEIDDAVNQVKIKTAVSQEPDQNSQNQTYSSYPDQGYSQASQETYDSYPTPDQSTQYQSYESSSQGYGQQDYGNYDGGGYYQQTSTDTVTDIAEQVVNKKMQELSKILEKVVQTTNSSERELNDIKERIKRIENSLDAIQKAIIGKIGEFGESTRMVQKDLENIHGTMSKMMNPLIDNYNELKKINSKK